MTLEEVEQAGVLARALSDIKLIRGKLDEDKNKIVSIGVSNISSSRGMANWAVLDKNLATEMFKLAEEFYKKELSALGIEV